MSKILIEGNKVIIDGHASDLETCNTLTNLCDELSTSDKFRTVRYESGYGEFESISENKENKFIDTPDIPLPPPLIPFDIYSNDGTTVYYSGNIEEMDLMEVTSTGVSINGSSVYTYSGNKVFLGFSDKVNSTSATFPVGYTGTGINISASNKLYIVEANPGFQVNIQSNDGTATLTQNATVNSVVVTSTGAQLKYGDTVNATYTYDGSKLFAGLATSANATAPKYKPGDTIEITAATTFYIVENIIIPEHHSSLTELFTNIATVIREKTGDKASIVADDFPNVIRERLRVMLIRFTIDDTHGTMVTYQAEKGMTWREWVNSTYNTEGFVTKNDMVYNSTQKYYVCPYNVFGSPVSLEEVIIDGKKFMLDNSPVVI